jgi:hypothetical protein
MKTDLPRLDKTAIDIVSLRAPDDSVPYWLERSPAERLNAIEVNRRMVYGIDRTASRLQRFLEVVELTQS